MWLHVHQGWDHPDGALFCHRLNMSTRDTTRRSSLFSLTGYINIRDIIYIYTGTSLYILGIYIYILILGEWSWNIQNDALKSWPWSSAGLGPLGPLSPLGPSGPSGGTRRARWGPSSPSGPLGQLGPTLGQSGSPAVWGSWKGIL